MMTANDKYRDQGNRSTQVVVRSIAKNTKTAAPRSAFLCPMDEITSPLALRNQAG